MKKEEIETNCQKVIDRYKELDTLFDKMSDLLGTTIDSPLGEAVWRLFDDYTTEIEAKIGDSNSFLSWYIYDNRCGEGNLEAAVNGEQGKKISNVKRLAHLIKNYDK